MKKIVLALVLATFASSALADRDDFHGGYHGGGHYEHYYHGGGHGGGNDWLAPLLIGGVAGYVLAQPPRTVVIQQPPVIVQQAPVVVPAPPYGYHYETVVDANCNCYRTILVSNY
jgi:hypothetical protein